MADTMRVLEKNPAWKGRRGPVVLVIMDGVGYGKFEEGDAVKASRMKYLDWFTANCPHTRLKAHGTAVLVRLPHIAFHLGDDASDNAKLRLMHQNLAQKLLGHSQPIPGKKFSF